MKERIVQLGLFGLLFAFVGCRDSGPPLVPAEGTITYKNAPLANANIVVLYSDRNSATGMSDEKGAFQLVYSNGKIGAVPGTGLKVTVTKVASGYSAPTDPTTAPEVQFAQGTKGMKGPPTDQMKTQQQGKFKEGLKGAPMEKSELPAQYADASKSGLTIDIPAGGKKDIKIELN